MRQCCLLTEAFVAALKAAFLQLDQESKADFTLSTGMSDDNIAAQTTQW